MNPRLCPACGTVNLKPFENTGLEVDCCPQCSGIWLDREELKQLIERVDFSDSLDQATAVARETARHTSRLCPGCHHELTESVLGDIFIDVCARCRGIWLDQGELGRAVEQYRQGRRGNLVVINQIAEGLRARQRPEV